MLLAKSGWSEVLPNRSDLSCDVLFIINALLEGNYI